MPLEVEQKYRIDDAAALRAVLARLGVVFDAPVRQVDRYFNHPARDFATTDEALRIRSVGERNVLTYKGPKLDRTVKTRREVEPALGDGAVAADQLAEVLVLLGFRPSASVVKNRSEGELHLHGETFTVSWDEVEGVGAFLEVELVVPDAAAEEARRKILAVERELGLTNVERRSYLAMVLERTGGS